MKIGDVVGTTFEQSFTLESGEKWKILNKY